MDLISKVNFGITFLSIFDINGFSDHGNSGFLTCNFASLEICKWVADSLVCLHAVSIKKKKKKSHKIKSVKRGEIFVAESVNEGGVHIWKSRRADGSLPPAGHFEMAHFVTSLTTGILPCGRPLESY